MCQHQSKQQQSTSSAENVGEIFEKNFLNNETSKLFNHFTNYKLGTNFAVFFVILKIILEIL